MIINQLKFKRASLFLLIVLSTILDYPALAAFNNKQIIIEPPSSNSVDKPPASIHKPKIRIKKRSFTINIARQLLVAQFAKHKKSSARNGKNSGWKVALLVVLFFLAALLVFAIAYGGASGGVIILSGALALGLLVWLGIRMFKPKRRKEGNAH